MDISRARCAECDRPMAVFSMVCSRCDVRLEGDFFGDENLRGIQRLQIVACGTALHAALVARYQLEGLAGVPVFLKKMSSSAWLPENASKSPSPSISTKAGAV